MVHVFIARLPLSLHFTLAQDQTSVSVGQSRLGVPKVRSVVNFNDGLRAEDKVWSKMVHATLYLRMSALATTAARIWDSIGSGCDMALGRFHICRPEAATST